MASFDELRHAADAAGVNLLHVYLDAGLADSTYYRHRDGRNGMTVATYNTLNKSISKLAQKAAA